MANTNVAIEKKTVVNQKNLKNEEKTKPGNQINKKPQYKQNEVKKPLEISKPKKLRELKNDENFKILIIGDRGIGKTSIMKRYCENVFSDSTTPTCGMGLDNKTITKGTKNVNLQFWDTHCDKA